MTTPPLAASTQPTPDPAPEFFSELPPDTVAPPTAEALPTSGARQQRLKRRLQRRTEHAPEWCSAFLAGNHREKTRLKRELATLKGSVVWLVRQRRQGNWTVHEREHLRGVMRTASSVSPYLLIWVVPGSLLLLPFLAWFIDHRRKGGAQPPESP